MVEVGNLLRMKRMIDSPCQSSLFYDFDRKHSSAGVCALAPLLLTTGMRVPVLACDTFGFPAGVAGVLHVSF
jgi:hypothetical protein